MRTWRLCMEKTKKDPYAALRRLHSPASISASFQKASKLHGKTQRRWQDLGDSLPVGTVVHGWKLTNVAGDLFWISPDGSKGETSSQFVERFGVKGIEAALARVEK